MDFATVSCPSKLYRVGRVRDVASFVDWRWLHGQGRYDDPRIAHERAEVENALRTASREDVERTFASTMEAKTGDGRPFRTLYAASRPAGAIVEIAQNWRANRTAIAEILQVIEDDPTVPSEPARMNVPPFYVGEVLVDDARPLVDVERSVQRFRSELLDSATMLGLEDVTRGGLLGRVRDFTQLAASTVYRDAGKYAGLYYGSVLGAQYENFALFESSREDPRGVFHTGQTRRLEVGDADLTKALAYLEMTLEPATDLPRGRSLRARDVGGREESPYRRTTTISTRCSRTVAGK